MRPAPPTAPATASAPGKLILSGEHAVVYGEPAVLLAVDLRVRVRAEPAPTWTLELPGTPVARLGGVADLDRRRRELETAHAEFMAGLRPIGEVAPHPVTLLAYACALAGGDPLRLQIESDLPLGAGMGSSAAVAAAVIAAILAARKAPADPERLIPLALAVERLQHGRPSGADVAAVVRGGLLRFRNGEVESRRSPPNRGLRLVDTGRPDSPTGECVEAVRARHGLDRGAWASFGAVAAEIEAAFAGDEEERLIRAVRRNHRLLCQIGVVPEPVQALVCEIEAAGGAAKICGAGAVRGSAGGMLWTLGPSDPIPALAARRGWRVIEVKGTGTGVEAKGAGR